MSEAEPIMVIFAEGNQMKSRYNQKSLNVFELIGFLITEIDHLKKEIENEPD